MLESAQERGAELPAALIYTVGMAYIEDPSAQVESASATQDDDSAVPGSSIPAKPLTNASTGNLSRGDNAQSSQYALALANGANADGQSPGDVCSHNFRSHSNAA
jgi:hypothetical protein